MASMLIKNLPDHLHQLLKQRAKRHHRSLNKEVIALLEDPLRRPTSDALLASDDARLNQLYHSILKPQVGDQIAVYALPR